VIVIDLNVLLDVLQKREPHYRASAGVLELVVKGSIAARVPTHAITTIHYVVSRSRDDKAADAAVDWLIRYLDVIQVTREELLRARALGWPDFEDAVVAAAAESAGCSRIVTRNVADFYGSAVLAVTPEEFILDLDVNSGDAAQSD
jgi:predicted nucleic acid-binding protein